MAADAVIRPVHRQFEAGHLHKQGNPLAGGIGFEQGVITVAIEAVAIFHTGEHRKHG